MTDPTSGFGLCIPTMSGASLEGRRLGLMTLIDEFSRRCLAIYVAAALIDMNTGHITTPDCCNEGAESIVKNRSSEAYGSSHGWGRDPHVCAFAALEWAYCGTVFGIVVVRARRSS